MNDSELMNREEVAEMLGIAPDAVRSTMRRHGIERIEGWPREAVEALHGRREARRTAQARPE